jgi:hypothetical protein
MGPDRGTKSWKGPLEKVTTRAEQWSSTALGLQLAAAAYTTYIMSTCTFIAQLDPLPPEWKAVELKAMRKLVPGPGNWCTARDLHLLKDGYHFPKAFPDLQITALACKMRVYHFENRACGGLQVFRRLEALKRKTAANQWMGRSVRWKEWLEGSFLQQLQSARDECATKGITHRGTLQEASRDAPRPWTLPTWIRIRKDYQKTIRARLTGDTRPEVHTRMRKRLERLPLASFPRIRVQRALQVLPRLEKLIPPRVHAAILRTWWNGWQTARRFQLTTAVARKCIFGCQGGETILWSTTLHARQCGPSRGDILAGHHRKGHRHTASRPSCSCSQPSPMRGWHEMHCGWRQSMPYTTGSGICDPRRTTRR